MNERKSVIGWSTLGLRSCRNRAIFFRFVPTEEAIDLINVAFEQKNLPGYPQNKNTKKGKTRKNETPTKPAGNFSVPDRITGISGLEELQCINPLRQWNFIEVILRVFSHDVTAAILVFQNNKTAVMLLYQTNPVWGYMWMLCRVALGTQMVEQRINSEV